MFMYENEVPFYDLLFNFEHNKIVVGWWTLSSLENILHRHVFLRAPTYLKISVKFWSDIAILSNKVPN